ncbi:MAG: SIS domain-containing protein [Dehalococcoidales bacterium]|jgi:D-sedoheptulose 7-phosphate isomerase|nr:phosphoheptose isomerase [Dehalococcoidales bacterium]MDP6043281.1 SIS domain-containing protein [Dehalococcoidales bacterium]MDP6448479.1 SIS domain-containing protein [Dehalococcoidales bacterium]MDP6576510.1 SIS domain-containing protein [Dehalococcoidales bacterium]MDP7286107.1 SIS domain-containing protein [Dehalococcoidales bacterium]
MSIVQSYLKGLTGCLEELSRWEAEIERAADIIFAAYQKGKQVFIMGNGGSASTASHCALGFAKQSAVMGKPRLKAKSLADNIGLITAWGNDADYSSVFLEQLRDQLAPGDVVIGISASGNSPNVLRAVEYAKEEGAATITLIGFGGGKLKQLADESIALSSRDYGQVEDAHLALTHILSDFLKEKIASN